MRTMIHSYHNMLCKILGMTTSSKKRTALRVTIHSDRQQQSADRTFDDRKIAFWNSAGLHNDIQNINEVKLSADISLAFYRIFKQQFDQTKFSTDKFRKDEQELANEFIRIKNIHTQQLLKNVHFDFTFESYSSITFLVFISGIKAIAELCNGSIDLFEGMVSKATTIAFKDVTGLDYQLKTTTNIIESQDIIETFNEHLSISTNVNISDQKKIDLYTSTNSTSTAAKLFVSFGIPLLVLWLLFDCARDFHKQQIETMVHINNTYRNIINEDTQRIKHYTEQFQQLMNKSSQKERPIIIKKFIYPSDRCLRCCH